MAKLDEKKKVLEVIDPFNNDLFDEDPKVVDGEIIVSEENPFTVEFDPEFLNVTASDYDDEFEEEESKSDAETALDVIKDKLDIEVEDDLLVVSEKGQSDNPDAPKVETEITEEEAEVVESEFDVEPEVHEDEHEKGLEDTDEEENSTEDVEDDEESDEDESEAEEIDESLLLEGPFNAIKNAIANKRLNKSGNKFLVTVYTKSPYAEDADARRTYDDIKKAEDYAKALSLNPKYDSAYVYNGEQATKSTRLLKYANGKVVESNLKAAGIDAKNKAKSEEQAAELAKDSVEDKAKAEKPEQKPTAEVDDTTQQPLAAETEKPTEQPKPEEVATSEQNSTEEEKPVGEQPAAAEASTEEKPTATGKGATLNKRVEMNKKIVKALDDVKPGLATELGLATTNDKGRLKGTDKLTSLRKALFGESIEVFDEDFEESYANIPFDSDIKVGDKVKIIHLAGESTEYDGREGTVERIDSIGQLHGTWGGLAIIPGVDEYEIITESLKEEKEAGDKVKSYNDGLKLAKLYGKPVIYGYTNKLLDGKFFALDDPIVCDDVKADSNKFRAQYKGCSVVYIAYPDKAFIEDEEKKQEIQDLINFDKKIEN